MDTSGDGELSKREFRSALNEMGFRFSERQVKDILFRVDSDGNGKCDYEEFENLCTGKGKKGKKSKAFDIDNDILRKLRRAKVVKRGDLAESLANADEDVNRRSKEYLKVDDFKNFIKESLDDVRLSRSDMKDLIESVDPDDSGKVKYDKFVQAVDK